MQRLNLFCCADNQFICEVYEIIKLPDSRAGPAIFMEDGKNLVSVSSRLGSEVSGEGGDAGYVFAYDVEFEIDFGVFLDAAEVGVFEGVGDYSYAELVAL